MQLLDVPPNKENGYLIKATEGKRHNSETWRGLLIILILLLCRTDFILSLSVGNVL